MPSIHPTASSDIVFISPTFKGVSREWFSPEHWEQEDKLTRTATGRGTVWFVETPSATAVLRQYRRGGLIAKVNKFKFLSQPLQSTRVYLELTLLEKLQQLGLPAPKPIGGMLRREGLFYEAWLMTEMIPNSADLNEILTTSQLDEATWVSIGQTIREFHQKGIYHSDLNCHNIMLDDQNKVWLIDFDKCSQRIPNPSWQKKNLDRLLRSFKKEQLKNPAFSANDTTWQWLLNGYENG